MNRSSPDLHNVIPASSYSSHLDFLGPQMCLFPFPSGPLHMMFSYSERFLHLLYPPALLPSLSPSILKQLIAQQLVNKQNEEYPHNKILLSNNIYSKDVFNRKELLIRTT